ncbi:MAG: DUF1646 family protein [Methylobacillus sp.]|jgi:Na+/H+ antiporter NhaD/arsenite permease-like protein|nr:DUF1646 family protein [Methylobacillus sp.]
MELPISPRDLTIILFCCVYLALALGHLPGFRLDRTGAVLAGAMLLVATGCIAPAAAWNAVDYRTLGLLFGLMVMSAAFSVSGFYDWVAEKVGGLDVAPASLLAILIVVSAALSALLTNDVVAVAMTSMLVSICLTRGLNPVPFLIGFCFAVNAGAAATLIGSPQNMVAAEMLHLTFVGFLKASALPAVLSLPLIWGVLAFFYRGRWHLGESGDAPPAALPAPIALDKQGTLKAGLVTAAVIIAFVTTKLPHVLIALAGASLLLISRRVASRDVLSKVDGSLLLLVMGLFIVNATMDTTGIPKELLGELRDAGFNLHNPISMLVIMAILSNLIGNITAVMLIAPYIKDVAHPEALGAAIALGTNFSSNAFIFGSLVGIIVAEAGRKHGVIIRFGEFAKAGIPVAVLTLLLSGIWIAML